MDEDAHITTGVQRALWLRTDNTFNEKNCNLVPTICSILKDFAQESNCDKGDIKISVMQPGSRVFPNCGPTNFVLEAQLGLISPSEARVRVGKEVSPTVYNYLKAKWLYCCDLDTRLENWKVSRFRQKF